MDAPTWEADAACRGHDPELFFGEGPGDAATAKRICAGCPVSEECLATAIARDDTIAYGVWGGVTGPVRTEWRRAAQRQVA
jgi:WhiB family redox-sensing transcriptional regulator